MGDGDGGGGQGDGGGGEGGGGGGGGGGGESTVQLGMLLVVVEEAVPGSEMLDVKAGVPPDVHKQHGSPSSRPLLCPSPSLSAWHKAVVHCSWAPLKAFLNDKSPEWPVALPFT